MSSHPLLTVDGPLKGLTTYKEEFAEHMFLIRETASEAPRDRMRIERDASVSHTDAVTQLRMTTVGGTTMLISGSRDGVVKLWR
jgi:hypothetical protein